MNQKLCGVCNQCAKKYKCPICLIAYCSGGCFHSHKTTCKPKLEPPTHKELSENVTPQDEYEFETKDTVSQEKLKELETDGTIRALLDNPHLRRLLTSVTSAADPARAMDDAMNEPIFVELASRCLRVVDAS